MKQYGELLLSIGIADFLVIFLVSMLMGIDVGAFTWYLTFFTMLGFGIPGALIWTLCRRYLFGNQMGLWTDIISAIVSVVVLMLVLVGIGELSGVNDPQSNGAAGVWMMLSLVFLPIVTIVSIFLRWCAAMMNRPPASLCCSDQGNDGRPL